MSRRITNAIRYGIVSKVLESTFKDRNEALLELEHDAAQLAYFKLVPIEHRRLMSELPADYFTAGDRISFQMVVKNTGTERHTLTLKESELFPSVYRYGCTETLTGEKLHNAMVKYYDTQKQLTKDYNLLQAKVNAILATTNTEKQLLEAWPEAATFIPYDMFPPPPQPLAITGNMINELVECSREGTCA